MSEFEFVIVVRMSVCRILSQKKEKLYVAIEVVLLPLHIGEPDVESKNNGVFK